MCVADIGHISVHIAISDGAAKKLVGRKQQVPLSGGRVNSFTEASERTLFTLVRQTTQCAKVRHRVRPSGLWLFQKHRCPCLNIFSRILRHRLFSANFYSTS